MAQTKSTTKKSGNKRAASAGASKKGAAKTKTKAAKSRSKASSTAARASSGNGSSKGVSGGIDAAREAIEDVGQKAGKATSKAKVPLIAGGAALVGAASGVALNAARSNGSKVLGVKMPKTKVKISTKDLAKAADRVAGAGEQIGRLSTGIRELQGTSDGDRGNGRHRSPIEVVIQGLTRRH
jgi:hypothetical protein